MSHFYEAVDTGVEPRHFVPLKSRPDELRPTRITDVKKWWREGKTVVPSVTTVLNTLNKHALNAWKIDQHLFQAHRLDPSDFYSVEAYLAEVKRLTELEMDKAPSAGTDLHGKLEQYLLQELPLSDPDHPLCEQVFMRIRRETGVSGEEFADACGPEARFTSPLGFGGCVDLAGCGWVIDYKTKQTAAKFKPGKMAYPDHSMQLAAYREGLGMPDAKAANVFVCLETGDIDFHEHTEEQLQHGWAMFRHALAIWKLQNNFPEELAEAA